MKSQKAAGLTDLVTWVKTAGPLAVAVSGGVDSLTLATVVRRHSTASVVAFHAESAAVPAAAGDRIRTWAAGEDVELIIVNAAEFDDPRYVANPVDRCRFCKTDLYGAIARHTDALIVSGTNTHDLDEWRPGLQAAKSAGVRHPFVECGIDKSAVRIIATSYGLGQIAELPAAPCLASRIETGLPIVAVQLQAIDAVERETDRRAGPGDIRCRLRTSGVVIEVDDAVAARLCTEDREEITALVLHRFDDVRQVMFAPYRRGSAFVGVPKVGSARTAPA